VATPRDIRPRDFEIKLLMLKRSGLEPDTTFKEGERNAPRGKLT
jgi:hypothetical protein